MANEITVSEHVQIDGSSGETNQKIVATNVGNQFTGEFRVPIQGETQNICDVFVKKGALEDIEAIDTSELADPGFTLETIATKFNQLLNALKSSSAMLLACLVFGSVAYGDGVDGKAKLREIGANQYVVTNEVDGVFHNWLDSGGLDGKMDATNGIAIGSIKIEPEQPPQGLVGQGNVEITHDTIIFRNTTAAPNTEYKDDGITIGDESYKFDSSTNGVARLKDVDAATNTIYKAISNDFVRMADLQDGITFNTMTVTNLTIDGKQPSLEGHTHTIDEMTDLTGLYSIPGAEQAATNCINAIQSAHTISEIKDALVDFLGNFKKPQN